MGVVLYGLERVLDTNGSVGGTVGRQGALTGDVLKPEVNGIDAQLLGQYVQRALNGECGHRSRWCSIGCNLGAIHDNVPPHGAVVLDVVAGKGRHAAQHGPGAWERTPLVSHVRRGGSNSAVFLRTDPHIDGGRGSWTRCAKHLLATHDKLHRPIRLTR